jgi:Na+-driven multidrug efflux pump
VTVFAMQGIKRPAYGLWIGLYRQVAAPLVVFHMLTFTLGWGIWGIWWGICLVTWSAALFAVGWGSWKLAIPKAQLADRLPSLTSPKLSQKKGTE